MRRSRRSPGTTKQISHAPPRLRASAGRRADGAWGHLRAARPTAGAPGFAEIAATPPMTREQLASLLSPRRWIGWECIRHLPRRVSVAVEKSIGQKRVYEAVCFAAAVFRGRVSSAMNLHQRAISPARDPTPTVRYEMAYSRENPLRVEAFERLVAMATAPYFGSRRVFPRRFDRAFAQILTDTTAKVVPEHAIWYYGSTLHLDIDPLSLTHRISDWVAYAEGRSLDGNVFPRFGRLERGDRAGGQVANPPRDAGVRYGRRRPPRYEGISRDDARDKARPAEHVATARRSTNGEAVEAYLRYCRDLIKSMRKRGAVRHSQSGPFHRLRLKHRDVRSPVHDSTRAGHRRRRSPRAASLSAISAASIAPRSPRRCSCRAFRWRSGWCTPLG